MNAPREIDTTGDLSALSWVHEELRRSLEAAHKSLRRYLKESEGLAGTDVDTVDPAVLRQARAQIHQGAGALELVGLPTAAQMLRASEAAVARLASRPRLANTAAVETIERGSFALLDYLARQLAGKPVSTLAMFPQYRALQELAGGTRIHPADLWPIDWQWREVRTADQPPVPALHADAETRARIEAETLAVMRGADPQAPMRMSDLFAGLAAGATGRLAALWQLAAAVFEGQANGLLKADAYSKRVASRLLAQLRAGDGADPSDRLAQDLLFFCAQSAGTPDLKPGPRLSAVRQTWGLAANTPVDYEVGQLGRFDPAWITQARKRVAGAKDVWSGVASGELQRLVSLNEQFALVGDSLTKLFPQGEVLAQALQAVANQTVAAGAAPSVELGMEVATCLLYVDATLEDADLDHPDMALRVRRLARRVEEVRAGRQADPLEPWMEDLYRRVSDRQTMGSVVQELRASLSEVEKQIDQYFRDPSKREVLIPVPGALSSMRGVLSVLGMDQASHAVVRMRDDVDALAQTEVDPQKAAEVGTFNRLADNLGALSFLIDMLSVQPQMAKSLFRFDAASGNLEAVMGRAQRPSGFGALEVATTIEPRIVEQAQLVAESAAKPSIDPIKLALDLSELSRDAADSNLGDLADAAGEASQALARATEPGELESARLSALHKLSDFVASVSGAPLVPTLDLGEPTAPAPLSSPPAPAPATEATGLEDDDEMRGIFLEEAREVIQNAREALAELADESGNVEQITTVRRAFHTLKGSSRMVGLKAFGEAAWSCEQLYNARLADSPNADADLMGFTHEALDRFSQWVDAIEAGTAAGFVHEDISIPADALRQERRRLAVGTRVAPEPTQAPVLESLTSRLQDLPPAEALDLRAPALPEIEPVAAAPELPALPEVSLELPTEPAAAEAKPLFEVLSPTEAEAEPTEAPLSDFATTDIEIEFDELAPPSIPEPAAYVPPTVELAPAVEPTPAAPLSPQAGPLVSTAPELEPEQVKVIGPLRVSISLFNIFLNEADELSRRLATEVAEWSHELHRPVGETAVALAHSLAGSSSTVGYADLSQLARALEHALMRSDERGQGTPHEAALFAEAAEEVRRLLHQFAAGFLRAPEPTLLQRLAEDEAANAAAVLRESELVEPVPAVPTAVEPASWAEAPVAPQPEPQAIEPTAPTPAQAEDEASHFGTLGQAEVRDFAELAVPTTARQPAVRADALDDADDIDAVDAVDPELFPIFEEEALELIPQLQSRMREWADRPGDASSASACMRTLHTLKGGARLAGAMRLGEMAHRLETAIEHHLARDDGSTPDMDPLVMRVDAIEAAFEAMRRGEPLASAPMGLDELPPAVAEARSTRPADLPEVPLSMYAGLPEAPATPVVPEAEPQPSEAAAPAGEFDWARFTKVRTDQPVVRSTAVSGSSQAAVRVRAPLLDRLVGHAGEVSITRARIESDVGQLKTSLGDLTENLERLRRQLRDIELQAETQIASRIEAAKAASQSFDPLEMDRFTRFQELTRMMAESVNDVATVQRGLQRTLQSAEDELAAQARLTRDLQDDLLRTRMVEFEGLSERLYRVVRQAAKESGKQVRLDIVGGSIEIDRGVLDRMTGAFEHVLRNCVTHGVEMPEQRQAAGKDATGSITIVVTQEGNEVAVEFRDDGAGLDLERIRAKAETTGLLAPGSQPSEAELVNLIFTPGFSTAASVTELAGRGVGMDVVRADVNAMGGRIVTATAQGKGTSFRLVLPLTTAVTQVVMVRCADVTVAIPAPLIEIVRRVPVADVERAYASGVYRGEAQEVAFFWLGALLQSSSRGQLAGRMATLVFVRSAAQRVALHVDEVVGNQEVVVKNLGPQLARLPGLAGMTLLPSGSPALIYNPVALATLYGESARARMRELPTAPVVEVVSTEPKAPLVLVVDDSLTVRRVTQRLLTREGYRVTLAKDGLEGLERLADERPAVVLSDIEMPRMDGFDLVRNMRADPQLADLPVIMITSRIAQKHRDYAAQMGVDHYLGKPYSEDELLSLVARYAHATEQA